MPRRPLPIAAAFCGAGIIYQHLAADALLKILLTGVCALLPVMLFSFLYEWNKIEIKDINNNLDEGLREYMEEERRERLCRGRRFLEIAVVFFLMGAVSGFCSENRVSQLNDAIGTEIAVAGRILSADIRQEYCILVMSACAYAAPEPPGGEELFQEDGGGQALCAALRQNSGIRERILIRAEDLEGAAAAALTGRFAVVRGIPGEASPASNPGTFDYRRYLRSRKIFLTMSAEPEKISVSASEPGFLYLLLNRTAVLRQSFEAKIAGAFEPQAAEMLGGILFGDDGAMEEDLKKSFQRNGLAHLLAASGLHAGFVYGLLSLLLGKPATFCRGIPVAAGLVFYAALAGFSPSVVRAVFMILVRMIARILHRPYDFLSCIAFCLLVMLLWEPQMLFSSGVQLSFAAVLTLSVVLRRMEQLTEGFCRSLGDRRGAQVRPALGALSGVAALQLGMTPLTLVHFHYISPAGLLLNGPAIALAGLIVPLGILLMPLAFAGGPLFAFFGSMEEMLLRLLLFLNNLMTGTPAAFHYTATPSPGILLLYYILLFFFCSEAGSAFRREVRSRRAAALALAGVLLVCGAFGFAVREPYLLSDLIFVDVGQGDCAHLKAAGANILFDTGGAESFGEETQGEETEEHRDLEDPVGEDVLIPYLLGNGVASLDAVVLSHLHQDHCGALKTLAGAVKVRRLILPAVYESQAGELSRQFGIPQDHLIFAVAGDRIRLGKAEIAVLTPERGTPEEYRQRLEQSDDENSLCMVVQVRYRNRTVLFTGDIDEEGEASLVRIYGQGAPAAAGEAEGTVLKSDILKVAHHGSRFASSTPFLLSAAPTVSVIQVGRNFYGHPSQEAMERIAACGSRIYRNDTRGAVMIRLGRTLRVRTMKGSPEMDAG